MLMVFALGFVVFDIAIGAGAVVFGRGGPHV
jgi:hypothetical protein